MEVQDVVLAQETELRAWVSGRGQDLEASVGVYGEQ